MYILKYCKYRYYHMCTYAFSFINVYENATFILINRPLKIKLIIDVQNKKFKKYFNG